MSLRSKLLLSIGVIAVFAVTAMADTIRLKDGSIIKGQIVSFNGGSFVVEIGDGSRRRQLTFSAGEVESIRFEARAAAPQLTQSTNRTASYTEPQPKTDNEMSTTSETIKLGEAKAEQPKPENKVQPKSSEKMKPIEWKIKVTADARSNGWTNTGWVVKKGQRIHISGDGKVSLGNGKTAPPSGIADFEDSMKLLKNVPTGALIAVIGDDNNDFIYIGAEREITATRDGALFLGINEGKLEDNSGVFDVNVSIIPGDN